MKEMLMLTSNYRCLLNKKSKTLIICNKLQSLLTEIKSLKSSGLQMSLEKSFTNFDLQSLVIIIRCRWSFGLLQDTLRKTIEIGNKNKISMKTRKNKLKKVKIRLFYNPAIPVQLLKISATKPFLATIQQVSSVSPQQMKTSDFQSYTWHKKTFPTQSKSRTHTQLLIISSAC